MNNRRSFLRIFFVLTAFGMVSLLAMFSRSVPSYIRAVDIVHLIGTGMCFGGAIIALIAHFRGRQSS